MDWFSSAVRAGSEAVARISESIDNERKELVAEYSQCTAGCSTASSAASGSFGAGASLLNLRRVGLSLLNPIDDQQSLADEKNGGGGGGSSEMLMLPWEAPGLTPEVRSRMRAISQERSTFLAPPAGDDGSFRFDMTESVGVVLEALSVDKHLERQRHLLVPQQISEEAFFRNYFWHLHALANGTVAPSASDSSEAASSPLVVNGSSSSEGTEVVAASSRTPPEEQFECLSEELFACAVASKLKAPPQPRATPGQPASAPTAALNADEDDPAEGAPDEAPPLSADMLVSSWEAELRAEIDGLSEPAPSTSS